MTVFLETSLYRNMAGSSVVMKDWYSSLSRIPDVSAALRTPSDGPKPRPKGIDPKQGGGLFPRLGIGIEILRSFPREVRFLRKFRPDIVHTHDNPTLWLYSLISLFFDFTLVHSLHDGLGKGFISKIRMILPDYLVAVSSRDRLLADYHVNNCVEARQGRVPSGRVNVLLKLGVIGSICERKNQLFALRLLHSLRAAGRPYKLDLIGPVVEPRYADLLAQEIKKLDLEDSVVFVGEIPKGEIFDEERIYLFVSTHETQPLSAIEVLIAQRPCLLADLPHYSDLVSGLVAPSLVRLDVQAFCDALVKGDVDVSDYLQRTIQDRFSTSRFDADVKTVALELSAHRFRSRISEQAVP